LAKKSSNSFVVKILTSKPLGLKILQTLFAKPAPVKAFGGGGGGGMPQNARISQNELAEMSAMRAHFFKFFSAPIPKAPSGF
jgi:hypothetical protein